MSDAPKHLAEHPVHLGLDANAVVEPKFAGGPSWYQAYGERHAADGVEGRLVAQHTFLASWDTWEMHPKGHEVVICTAGRITLVQEIDGQHRRVTLEPGEYVINPPGVWHTADVAAPATAIFITAGMGTELRPRR